MKRATAQPLTGEDYAAMGFELAWSYTTYVNGELVRYEKWMPPLPDFTAPRGQIDYKMPGPKP